MFREVSPEVPRLHCRVLDYRRKLRDGHYLAFEPPLQLCGVGVCGLWVVMKSLLINSRETHCRVVATCFDNTSNIMSPSIEAELVSSDDDTEQEEVTLPGSEQEESIAISSETGSAYKLGPHDVLLGRGLGTYNHVGNIKFRKLVNENKLRYVAASKVDKPKVAKELVQLWRNLSPPGRFLARREDSAKEVSASVPEEDNWVEVGDKKAQEKTSQCLRERTPDILPFYKFKRACKNERKQALRVHQITPLEATAERPSDGLAGLHVQSCQPLHHQGVARRADPRGTTAATRSRCCPWDGTDA